MLLSNRFLTKLPVSESIQMQIDAALQGMKIDPSTLHCSKAVCDEFDNLREQMLIYFAIDKFINKKKEEQAEVKEWREEIESLLFVFEKNREYLDKNAKLLAE
jgi:predicted transcriptional regulator